LSESWKDFEPSEIESSFFLMKKGSCSSDMIPILESQTSDDLLLFIWLMCFDRVPGFSYLLAAL